jgi:predicted 3-demethylubiquinone-9 3-methyltransferase (glyoxalase superfamily)
LAPRKDRRNTRHVNPNGRCYGQAESDDVWYDNNAEEAARFYVSLFADSSIDRIVPGPEGKVLLVEFTLAGVQYFALNGGPHYKLTPAVSLSVECRDQAEIDHYWEKLSEGGMTIQCGWLTDRFGLSWQVVPVGLGQMMTDPDPAKSGRMMAALMTMTKLEIAALTKPFEGQS